MIVKYNCKFCGNPGSVEIEDNDATMFCVEKWAKLLCCDRCGKFQVAKRRIADTVKKNCISLLQRRKTTPDKEKLKEAEAAVRVSLVLLCSKYAEIVCKRWRKRNDFDDSFADDLMKQPQNCEAVLGQCEFVTRRNPT